MRVLCVMDKLEKLDLKWDSTLCLFRELSRRGHEIWICDTDDVRHEKNQVFFQARQIAPNGALKFKTIRTAVFPAQKTSLVLIRKEPPFDDAYLTLTHILELAANKTVIENHPAGIRNSNEKLSILKFQPWIPQTIVTNNPDQILDFQNQLKTDLVVKPLNDKGGKGVLRLGLNSPKKLLRLQTATQQGKIFVMAQEFIQGFGIYGEKRILILNSRVLAIYEKRPKRGDFRANLGLGGKAFPAKLTASEKKLVQELAVYFKKEGLSFVGIDTINGKLIEINVTCPAGLTDAIQLYRKNRFVEQWASSLEHLTKHSQVQKLPRF